MGDIQGGARFPKPSAPAIGGGSPKVPLNMDGEFDVYLQELKPFVKSAEQSKDADKKKNENKSKDKEKSEEKDKDKDKAAEGTDSEDSSKAAETPKPQEEGKPTVASSELITYKSLQESAKAHNNEKPRVYHCDYSARSSTRFFCLPGDDLTRVDNNLTLEEYQNRAPSAADGTAKKLTVNWTRNSSADLGKVLDDVPDIQKLGPSTWKPLEKPSMSLPAYESALASATKNRLQIDKVDAPNNAYTLQPEDWSRVIEANELLHAFRIDQEEVENLNNTTLDQLVGTGFASTTVMKDTYVPGATGTPEAPASGTPETPGSVTVPKTPFNQMDGADVTFSLNVKPIVPIPRSTRPLFAVHPRSSVLAVHKAGDALNASPIQIQAGPSWSNAKAVATTQIAKMQDSRNYWSVISGQSIDSLDAGVAFPIAKAVVGSTFGFQQEISKSKSDSAESTKTLLTVVHSVPCVQININETTVVLSSGAEYELKKIRRERRFADLMTFIDRYGSLVCQNITLCGRLFHTQDYSYSSTASACSNAERLKISANASLGIPNVLGLKAGGSHEKDKSKQAGSATASYAENLTWSGIGGNASLSVDPPNWRISLNDYTYWKPIQFNNPILIDDFIAKIPGYSDVPILFSDILATGVLNPAIVAIPPPGLPGLPSKVPLRLGMAIEPGTGTVAAETAATNADIKSSLEGPEGYSWSVLRTARDVKREIWASLQATLNPMVKVDYDQPLFLNDLRGSDTAFSIVLRWTSNTFIQEPTEEFAKTIWERGQTKPPQDEKLFFERVWQVYAADRENARRDRLAAAEEANRTTQQEANDTEKKNDDADYLKLSAAAQALVPWEANRGFIEDVFGKADGDREAAFSVEMAAEPDPTKQPAIQGRLEAQTTSDNDAHERLRATINKLMPVPNNVVTVPWDGKFLIRTITKRAWLMGIWQFKQAEMKSDFEALKSKLYKYFSEPQTIEGGCDCILENTGKQDNTEPAWVSFSLYGSNGPEQKEEKIRERRPAMGAYDAITSRINMSSIHALPVKVEIGTSPNQLFPAEFTMSEITLMQDQERKAKDIFKVTQEQL